MNTAHRPDLPEATLQRLILARLNALPGVHVWRSNTGAARGPDGRLIRFGVAGQADITGLLPGGRRLEVEVKTRTGRVRPEQRQFQDLITAHGGLYILARSLDDALTPVLACLQ